MVESALVYPILFLVVLGTVIVVMGVFRYMEVAALAREGCRWASVHGSQYAKDTGKPAATTSADVYNNVIALQAVGMDPSKLTCTVTWNPNPNDYHAILLENDAFPVLNTVRVTVTYQWVPEAFFPAINLTSTAESIMSY
jgi:Flp pilus assembly protein TadG